MGASDRILSYKQERVRGWNHKEWGDELPVDVPLQSAQPDDFDGMLLPRGVMNPDALRMELVDFVKSFL